MYYLTGSTLLVESNQDDRLSVNLNFLILVDLRTASHNLRTIFQNVPILVNIIKTSRWF